jgi:hypothetical protein
LIHLKIIANGKRKNDPQIEETKQEETPTQEQALAAASESTLEKPGKTPLTDAQ